MKTSSWLKTIFIGIIIVSWCFSALTASHAVEQTLILQRGLAGYAGVTDTWISTNDWAPTLQDTVNYGQNDVLKVERNEGDNPLLRFDLSSIPANSMVVSATLGLYNLTQSNPGGESTPAVCNLYGVLVDWDEGNQEDSPINVSGAHGATGYNAFEYYSGEGTNCSLVRTGYGRGPGFSQKSMRAMRTWLMRAGTRGM